MRSHIFFQCSVVLLSLPCIFGAPVTDASNPNGKLETSQMIAHAGGYPHRSPNSTINCTYPMLPAIIFSANLPSSTVTFHRSLQTPHSMFSLIGMLGQPSELFKLHDNPVPSSVVLQFPNSSQPWRHQGISSPLCTSPPFSFTLPARHSSASFTYLLFAQAIPVSDSRMTRSLVRFSGGMSNLLSFTH
jgi:hypothetical protein